MDGFFSIELPGTKKEMVKVQGEGEIENWGEKKEVKGETRVEISSRLSLFY